MKETVIRFLGKDLKIKSVCDDFVRLEYSEEFRAPGEFSCTLSLDRAYIPAIGEYALIGESALYVIEGRNGAHFGTRDTFVFLPADTARHREEFVPL